VELDVIVDAIREFLETGGIRGLLLSGNSSLSGSKSWSTSAAAGSGGDENYHGCAVEIFLHSMFPRSD
jgi:hypothetical protein